MSWDRLLIGGVVVLAVALGVAAQTGVILRPAGVLVGSFAGLDVPDLDDPAMLRRGAAHYDLVCAQCHASPARPEQADALELSPSPPKLHLRTDERSPEVLFSIVKHGIRGSGMPAWPTEDRDDEIWSMVAFLRALPGMPKDRYDSLAGSEVDGEVALAPLAGCVGCHGDDGRGSADGAFPRLDIQTPDYLLSALAAFRDGRRASGFMQSAVSGLRDDELQALAEHFGTATRPESQTGAEGSGPAACIACHGPPAPARPAFPSLTWQYESYLVRQLTLFADKEKPRGGGPFAELMQEAAHGLTAEQIERFASWYAAGAAGE